jgi:DNA-directed RNA polymerase specialized sigma24 family protein
MMAAVLDAERSPVDQPSTRSSLRDERPPMAIFPTTQWSCIAEASDPDSPGAHAALAELCRSYWYPIYSLIRSRGHPPDEAADLTQDYFGRLLGGGLLRTADRRKGRFRSLLRTDCGYFLADQRDRRRARKRGGGRERLPLDIADAERRYRLEPSDRLGPEPLFDRAWALDLLGRALDRLAREEATAGRGTTFERLRVVLTDGPRVVPYAAIAERLGTTEGAVEAAVRRLRGRYRVALRAEVAATLDDPSEAQVDDEIRDLFVALGR